MNTFLIMVITRNGNMSLLGKLHEISFYGLITTIIAVVNNKTTVGELLKYATATDSIKTSFLAYMFWSSILFIPIAIICAFATKYADAGEGLSFSSDNIVVIMFAHIGEELLGLILTPFWFLKYVFTHTLTGWRAFDCFTYLLELIFIGMGMTSIW